MTPQTHKFGVTACISALSRTVRLITIYRERPGYHVGHTDVTMTDPNDTTTDESTSDIAERIATSIDEQLGSTDDSRRGFLSKTALASGGLLAIGTGAGLTLADEHEDEDTAEMMADFDDVEGTDLDVLNYALTLEHLENNLYQTGREAFDRTAYAESETLADADDEMVDEVVSYVQTAGEQEATHVEVLTQAVELLGGDPAQEAEYEFGVESVDGFLTAAAAVENVGVSAYAGAAPFVQSPDLLGVALAIHSVEARHAAVLNNVVGESPFPNAFDGARSQQEVLDIAGQFMVDDTDGDGTDENGTDENGTDENGTDGTTTEPTTTDEGTTTMPGTETETENGNETE